MFLAEFVKKGMCSMHWGKSSAENPINSISCHLNVIAIWHFLERKCSSAKWYLSQLFLKHISESQNQHFELCLVLSEFFCRCCFLYFITGTVKFWLWSRVVSLPVGPEILLDYYYALLFSLSTHKISHLHLANQIFFNYRERDWKQNKHHNCA